MHTYSTASWSVVVIFCLLDEKISVNVFNMFSNSVYSRHLCRCMHWWRRSSFFPPPPVEGAKNKDSSVCVGLFRTFRFRDSAKGGKGCLQGWEGNVVEVLWRQENGRKILQTCQGVRFRTSTILPALLHFIRLLLFILLYSGLCLIQPVGLTSPFGKCRIYMEQNTEYSRHWLITPRIISPTA